MGAARAGLVTCVLVLSAGMAAAQGAGGAASHDKGGFLSWMGHWFEQSADNFSAGVDSVRKRFRNWGHEANVAAQKTVDNTKAAADAMARLPNTRVVHGHEQCKTAPNGAPDCVAAAEAVCKKKGFKGGSSVDMTTAEVCPAEIFLAGRNTGPGCHTETFVSRALCQ
ncbi:MAG: hypothetical protein P8Y53_15905 [Pseudolabrys sp.]|jgi:hypothetical protein